MGGGNLRTFLPAAIEGSFPHDVQIFQSWDGWKRWQNDALLLSGLILCVTEFLGMIWVGLPFGDALRRSYHRVFFFFLRWRQTEVGGGKDGFFVVMDRLVGWCW